MPHEITNYKSRVNNYEKLTLDFVFLKLDSTKLTMKFFLEYFVNDINKMSIKEHIYYWVIPTITMSILLIFYFSGNPVLVNIVSPLENREWGILENIQLVIIFFIFLLSTYTFLKKNHFFQKLGFCLISAFSIFVFLEEMDYGAHFVELIGGNEAMILKQYIPSKNLHNQGNNAIIFKRSVKLMIVLIFMIAPLLRFKIKNPYILYLIPQPRIVIVTLLTVLVYYLPQKVVTLHLAIDGGLGINIAEFSEVMIYFIFLVYLQQLTFVNRFPADKKLV